jgi:hypothetical protein
MGRAAVMGDSMTGKAGTISKAAQARQDRAEAIERLREIFPDGSTAYTVLRHVSASGMSREISVINRGTDDVWDCSYLVARALGWRIGKRGGIVIEGAGMDMGFHLVYEMSQTIHASEPGRVGSDRPGYAVKQRWI